MKKILLLAIISLFPCIGRGQWTGSTAGGPYTPYFLDTLRGFMFLPGITFHDPLTVSQGASAEVRRTTDGGATWQDVNGFANAALTQICFVSEQRGYASTASLTTGGGGIYETTDTGVDWKLISPKGLNFSGVYSAFGVVFASEIRVANGNIFGSILFSRNDGITWDSITSVKGLTLDAYPQFEWVYGNRDSLVATIYYASGSDTYLVYSTDLGLTWQSSALDQNYQVGMVTTLLVLPHTCTIFRQHRDSIDRNRVGFSFLESSYPYATWNPSLQHKETGVWISGNSCVMYLGDASPGSETYHSIYRTIGVSNNWNDIPNTSGGYPDFQTEDENDQQNMSVVGYGAFVCAVDRNSNFWKTTNGGDGTLSASKLAPQFALDCEPFAFRTQTLTIAQCTPTLMEFHNLNIGCSYAKFDSISIAGLDPTEYSENSTHHCACEPMQDTSFITIQPKVTGTRQLTVHYHFTDDEYNQIDTSIPIKLVVSSGSTPIALSFSIKPTTITAQPGDTVFIPVYLSGNATFGATSITLPFGIDTNALQPIGFYPSISGITVGSTIYSGGTWTVPLQSTSLTLNGETLIGTMRCIVYLADTHGTFVTLRNASITSANFPCVALSLTTDSVSIAIGSATVLQFTKTGQIPFGIQSIAPNPAGGEVQVSFLNPLSSSISYQVMDVLGAVRAEGSVSGDELSLDVHSLANGLYYLRVRDEESGAGVSGKFVVDR